MPDRVYMIMNSAAPTTAAPVKQATSVQIRTMLQLHVANVSGAGLSIVEWGISFDGSTAATPVECELFGTTVAATMSTATLAADITNLTSVGTNTSAITLGSTTNTGFATTAVTEGTVANYRFFDTQLVAPTNQYVKQFPLGLEPYLDANQYARIRVTAGTTVNCCCYIAWRE